MIGDRADLNLADHLLAHIANLLAGANWQRGGGKGGRPKPIRLGEKAGKPARSRAERGADYARRLTNLGLIPAAA